MQDLKIWEEKIKNKIKASSWKQFIETRASWYPLVFNKRKIGISRYPETKRSPQIVENKTFDENIDAHTKYGREYDFGKNFFMNFQELFLSIPLGKTFEISGKSENTDFADTISSSKNVYLSFNVTKGNENILYSLGVKDHIKDTLNSVMVWDNSEIVFNSVGIIKSFKIFYSRYISDSNNIWFSSNLMGCSECIFCEGLQNKNYCIENKEFDKETYFKEKENILKKKNEFYSYFEKLEKRGKNYGSTKVNGNFIIHSENVENGAMIYQVKNGKNILLSGYNYGMENIYTSLFCGAKSECYGGIGCGLMAENIYNSFGISGGQHLFYSHACSGGCSFLIGCIGLQNKHFCILNKQYSKEEWYELADKIFASMEKDGILGDFFPGELNPFYFNDTMAYLIDDSFTKEEVEKEGFMWRDEKIKVDIPEGAEIIYAKNPPVLSYIPLIKGDSQSGAKAEGVLSDYQGFDENRNWKINPEILKKVIVDNDGNYYKIVPMEYDFLMKYGLPLPEVHWLERIKMGFKF
ncbi:hypothetical protein HGA92_01415 [Candidatus Gracilibacteria bacterium]|nr:hypothetical protein [Candidatus Gracilibacteria bacterium]NUJ98732.1 hypothetical protein [Candidatus Gracilibacteria bacterium]